MASTVPDARSTLAKSVCQTLPITSPPALANPGAIVKKTIYPDKRPVGKLSLSASLNRVLALSPDASLPSSLSVSQADFQVLGLNHFNITASPPLIERIKRFYIDIAGLKLGARARLDHDGYWLYAGTSPILHLSARPGIEVAIESKQGYFNHISLACVGLKGAITRIAAANIPYRLIELSDIKQTQLFLTDPAGIGVELTFFNECL